MKYYLFMDTLKKNEYFLTRDVVGEIMRTPKTAHYRELSDGELHNRVHQIIYHVYKRHSSFMDNGAKGDVLGAWYLNLGQERFREGFPLDEVVEVFSIVRKRVMRCVEERMLPEEDWSMNEASKLYWNVSLFFDAMSTAVIEGYRKESGPGAEAR